ncbi:DNA glycosylase, partial [Cantharellus anzutake]|uniref:DNA glycosylase n=1 Tax=Cantharellus anzutake TaxID=1750568 RepID=UPI0019063504
LPRGFDAIRVLPSQLNLSLVLKCGQTFRWDRLDLEPYSPEWRFVLFDRVVCLRQNEEYIFFRTILANGVAEDSDWTRLWIQDYFHLHVDTEAIFNAVVDPIFIAARQHFGGGIRILRQDPWETLISFICSQNNNIPRITSMVHKLCLHFSQPLTLGPEDAELINPSNHPFPMPQSLAQPSVETDLRSLGFGYRAKFIQQTAALLCKKHEDPQKWLLSLRECTYESARDELMQLPGVGPKVADCVLLMSLDKHATVPIDTHMVSIAIKHYNFPAGNRMRGTTISPTTRGQMASFFHTQWVHMLVGSMASFSLPICHSLSLRP